MKRYLEFLRLHCDPVLRSMDEAPLEAEELREEVIASLREAKEDFKTGKALSTDEIRRDLGLL